MVLIVQPAETPISRGKVLDDAGVVAMKDWGRYKDVDGDAIPYRTLPGTPGDGKAAYFTRGSGHDENGRYSERPEIYVRNMDRLARKLETAKGMVPPPVVTGSGAKVGILAYGTTHWAVVEARDQLVAERKLATDYLRVRAFPFSEEIRSFIAGHDRVYVIEQNRDAQMLGMLRMAYPELTMRMRSVLHYNGLPVDARSLSDAIVASESAPAASKNGAL